MSPMDEPLILSANNSPRSPAPVIPPQPVCHFSVFPKFPFLFSLPPSFMSVKDGTTRILTFNPQGDFQSLFLLAPNFWSLTKTAASPLAQPFALMACLNHFVHCTAVSSPFFYSPPPPHPSLASPYPCHNVIKGLKKVADEAMDVCVREGGRVVQRLVGFP